MAYSFLSFQILMKYRLHDDTLEDNANALEDNANAFQLKRDGPLIDSTLRLRLRGRPGTFSLVDPMK